MRPDIPVMGRDGDVHAVRHPEPIPLLNRHQRMVENRMPGRWRNRGNRWHRRHAPGCGIPLKPVTLNRPQFTQVSIHPGLAVKRAAPEFVINDGVAQLRGVIGVVCAFARNLLFSQPEGLVVDHGAPKPCLQVSHRLAVPVRRGASI